MSGKIILLIITSIIIILLLIASAYNLYKGGKNENWNNIKSAGLLLLIAIIGSLINNYFIITSLKELKEIIIEKIQ